MERASHVIGGGLNGVLCKGLFRGAAPVDPSDVTSRASVTLMNFNYVCSSDTFFFTRLHRDVV